MNIASALEKSKHRRLLRFILLGAGALLCGLTLVIPKLDVFEWVALVPAAVAIIDISNDARMRKRGLYGYGFFFYFCFFAVNFHWFVNLYPLDFVDGISKPAALVVVLAGCVGLSALQAFFAGLVFVFFGYCVKDKLFEGRPYLCAVLFAMLWAVLEWSQTIGWIGVPWARLSVGQMGFLVGAQSASLFGSAFVGFLIVLVNFSVAYFLCSKESKRVLAIMALGVVAVNTALGAVLYMRNFESEDSVKISAVQGNISSQDKWDSAMDKKTLDVYEKYTAEAAEAGAEIVVWPETALPYNFSASYALNSYVRGLATEYNVTILVGTFTLGDDGEYNSLVAALPDGSFCDTVYSKRHLVPFGEYVPMRRFFEIFIPPLARIAMLSYDLEAGKEENVIYLDESALGGLICFDSIYGELARGSVLAGAQVLVISTNDSWFSGSAALHMHNSQAGLRAIENGRYVLRAANTGISSVIAPNGKNIANIAADTEGQMTETVYNIDNKTLYSYVGDIFVYFCILFVGYAICRRFIYKRI